MHTTQNDASTPEPAKPLTGCPIDHSAWSHQKTATSAEPVGKHIERDEAGVWQIYGFEEARAILRSSDTRQAGFGARRLETVPGTKHHSILYLEGPAHHEQRRRTARFFTPKPSARTTVPSWSVSVTGWSQTSNAKNVSISAR